MITRIINKITSIIPPARQPLLSDCLGGLLDGFCDGNCVVVFFACEVDGESATHWRSTALCAVGMVLFLS